MSKDDFARAHSKFSASGAERWFNCPGSVELSEGQPDKSSKWAEEGTLAHEVLEYTMLREIGHPASIDKEYPKGKVTIEMRDYGRAATKFIVDRWRKLPDSGIKVETRIYLKFIHPEMFGTFDSAILDYFGTLHVFDYKYGAGHAVSPTKNLQMIFYGIGMAFKYHWNFKNVRLWIIQPRIKGYDGPTFWDVPTFELKKYVDIFESKVEQVEKFPNKFAEGPWCWWCKAKAICPLKLKAKQESCITIFKNNPVDKVKLVEDFY